MTKEIHPLGNYTVYEYDGNGNRTKETVFDQSGQKLEETSFAYDSRNLLVQKTDANGNVYWYDYDALGRKVGYFDPLGNYTKYAYDSVGNLISETDPRGGTTEHVYDLAKQSRPSWNTISMAT